MHRKLVVSAICLLLAACAPGRATFSPPSDPKLAAAGWLDADIVLYGAGAGTHFNKSLICKGPSCGGIGFAASGYKPLPANIAASYRLLVNNRQITDSKLLAALQVSVLTSPLLARANCQINSAHKKLDSVRLTFSCNIPTQAAGLIYSLGVMNLTEDRMSIELGGGPTPARARERLRMAGD